MRRLCRLDELPPGSSRGFAPPPGAFTGLFAVRTKAGRDDGADVHVYLNACPHIGVALDWAPGQFLTGDGSQIVCATHGARFDIQTGLCTDGPCQADSLERAPVIIEDGWILVPETAGL